MKFKEERVISQHLAFSRKSCAPLLTSHYGISISKAGCFECLVFKTYLRSTMQCREMMHRRTVHLKPINFIKQYHLNKFNFKTLP